MPDFVVLGAGVMGTSVAFHLARRKAGRIVVVDQGLVGQGMSGRSSALIRMHYSFPPEVQLAVKSLEMLRHWTDLTGAPGDFRKTGFVRIVPEHETKRLESNVAMQRSLGVNAVVITSRELRELEPDWRVDDVAAAAYEPDSGYGDGAGVARDLLARARELGVEYRPETRVLDLTIDGGRLRGVKTDRGDIEAPLVVAATGPWSRPLFARAGLDLPIETEYHQVAILKNPPGMKWPACACIDSITNTYFRSEVGDLTLVGTFRGGRGVDPDAFPQSPSDESLGETASAVARRVPALDDAGIVKGITGVYDMTPDSRPLLGQVPGITGLHVVAGFSGMGFKISPAVGLAMSELILDGRAASVDIQAFRPGRFAEGCPIKAEFEYGDD